MWLNSATLPAAFSLLPGIFPIPRTECGSGLITCCETNLLRFKMHTIKRANASSAPLSEVGISVVRGMETEQQEMAGEAPSATARFYSNGRNSYSCLVPCARRPSKMQAALLPCSVHFVRCFVAFVNAFALVSTGCKTFVQTFETVWYYLFVS